MLALVLYLAVVTALVLAFALLALPVALTLMGLLVVGILIRVRLQGVGLLGPVFAIDLLRTTRSGNVFRMRILYLFILLIVLMQVHAIWRRHFPQGVRQEDLARFVLSLFYAFLAVQLVALLFMTPAATAGAVAEERERRSMAFLLATDLRDHEIVLGKFAARLVPLLGLLLAGLPVFALLQLLGGIDFLWVLLCFGGTLLTVLSVAGVSLLASVVSRRSRDAIILAYGIVLGYLGLTIVIDTAVKMNELTHYPTTDTWTSPVEVGDVVHAISTGHPIYAMRRMVESTSPALALSVLWQYARFHLVLLALTLGPAVLLLRWLGVGDPDPTAEHGMRMLGRTRTVGDEPVRWREMWTDRGLNSSIVAHFMAVLVVMASLLFAYWSATPGSFGLYDLNLWSRLMSTLLGSMMLLQVVLRAAGSIRIERDRDTLPGLLATPLTARAILFGKWCGALASIQMLALGLVTVWIVAGITGGLAPVAIVGQVLTWCAVAGALAVLGLWISLTATSALRATLNAVAGTMLLSFGHWAVWLFLLPAMTGPPQAGPLLYYQAALTPPLAFGWTFGYSTQPIEARFDDTIHRLVFAVAAMLTWVVFGMLLWRATVARFQAKFHREGEEN